MRVVALDFETALTTGEPSVQFYRDDFRAISCAFAWRDGDEVKTRYVVGERAIERDLLKLQQSDVTLVAHNLQFELAVLKARFPTFNTDLAKICTMRLAHNAYARKGFSLGLVSVAAKWLSVEYHDHKSPFHAVIRDRGAKRGTEGANLNLLTPDELRRYNVRDAEVTLALYERFTQLFNDLNFDWTIDHDLFRANLPFIIEAESRGILVDRDKAQQAVTVFSGQITRIEADFLDRYRDEIGTVERTLRERCLSKYRSEKGRLNAKLDHLKFNIYSPAQLTMLFIDVLKLVPMFKTKKGSATFGSKLLWSYGEPGRMLDKKGRAKIQRDQALALVENSELDGRWHHKIKAVGTVTDRYAGGDHEGT